MILDTLAAMPAPQIAAFLLGGLMMNLAPGQDVMFASACGMRGGPRAGMLAGLGVGFGGVAQVLLVTAGLGAVLARHPGAQQAVRLAGGAYLAWLAVRTWRSPAVAEDGRTDAGTGASLILRGTLNNLLNPKTLLFLLAFLPQFTNPAWGPVWHQVLALGLIFAATGTLVTMGYGALAGLARRGLAGRMQVLNRLSALLFAGLALRLVLA